MNFGEEIVYWYLRFNGFFPLTNFVLHRGEHADPSDCDLLAVRPPHVSEMIGGNLYDWDPILLKYWEDGRTIGIVCEVKSGRDIGDVFRPEHTRTALRRLGFSQSDRQLRAPLRTLARNATAEIAPSYRVVKLLFANRPLDAPQAWIYIPLKHARDFVRDRLDAYSEKQSDWVYFKSNLIQYLAWDSRWNDK